MNKRAKPAFFVWFGSFIFFKQSLLPHKMAQKLCLVQWVP